MKGLSKDPCSAAECVETAYCRKLRSFVRWNVQRGFETDHVADQLLKNVTLTKLDLVSGIKFTIGHLEWVEKKNYSKYYLHWIGIKQVPKLGGIFCPGKETRYKKCCSRDWPPEMLLNGQSPGIRSSARSGSPIGGKEMRNTIPRHIPNLYLSLSERIKSWRVRRDCRSCSTDDNFAIKKLISNIGLVKPYVTAINFTDSPSATPRMSSWACSTISHSKWCRACYADCSSGSNSYWLAG